MSASRRFLTLLAVVVGAPLFAADGVRSLSVFPAKISLKGRDAAQQVVVTATLADGRTRDATGDAELRPADARLVAIHPGGRIVPLASGKTDLVVTYKGQAARVAVAATDVETDLPINFANQIVPVFTKLGCNSGGCHGKLAGQNGFRLSLLGFEPELDYATLVKEARGRRVFPAAPERSLLLMKATGTAPHGGGKKMEKDSDEYKLVRRWIASGLPVGQADDPTVTAIRVIPDGRVLPRDGRQQVAVLARYSDGSEEDITRRAQYESNDGDVATVDGNGLVRSLSLSGEAAIMARYQGKVAVFRATVPLGLPTPAYTFEPKTVVDRHALAKWKQLGVVPSEVCPDDQFVRRASLDIAGTLPTPAQVAAFLADTDPRKREKLVDRLLDSPEYSYFFATKWADILRVKRGNQQGRAQGTFLFHNWIREALASDKPYSDFAREIVAAVGDESRCPPTVWFRDFGQNGADQFADNLAQVFLGTRLQCAQCHHHPYEKWGQDDYWGLAAFFGRVGTKTVPVAGNQNQGQQNQRRVLFTRPSGNVINKRTNQAAVIRALDAEPVAADAESDPRQALADWMTEAKNPFFAKAVANRYWAHFFGRGLVDPLDDMRITNPPSNPELLDAIAEDFVQNGYSLKALVRTICKSRTYSLSSVPNAFNKNDRQAYSRYYPKRLSAEVLFDAVCQVTDSPTAFQGLPQDRHAPRRAIMLPDESFASYFLDVFGRPQRLSACECERVSEANLAQALHLLNSEEVQNKIARPGGRADVLTKDPRPDAEKVDELFLWALGRKAGDKQRTLALENIKQNEKNKKAAYENILWALLNTKEFIFNR